MILEFTKKKRNIYICGRPVQYVHWLHHVKGTQSLIKSISPQQRQIHTSEVASSEEWLQVCLTDSQLPRLHRVHCPPTAALVATRSSPENAELRRARGRRVTVVHQTKGYRGVMGGNIAAAPQQYVKFRVLSAEQTQIARGQRCINLIENKPDKVAPACKGSESAAFKNEPQDVQIVCKLEFPESLH